MLNQITNTIDSEIQTKQQREEELTKLTIQFQEI